MAFELDEQQAPDAQPEVFRQGVEPDVSPEAPETPVEPPQEPQAPDVPEVEPSWLDGDPEPPRGYPQYPQEPLPQYPPHAPAYPPVPPPDYPPAAHRQQPMGSPDAVLNEFVKDPIGWVRSIQQETINQMSGPLTWQQQQLAENLNRMQMTYAEAGIKRADAAIRNAYKILNKNPVFKSNKQVQEHINRALKAQFNDAANAARQGNYVPIADLERIDEPALRGMVAFVSEATGVKSAGIGPLSVEGAAVETSRSAVTSEDITLTPEQEEVAKRMGPGYRDRMIQAQRDLLKHDDFEAGE
jgi:hypothetical protein